MTFVHVVIPGNNGSLEETRTLGDGDCSIGKGGYGVISEN